MFDNEFYPTPKQVIKTMLAPYYSELRSGINVLDPSAGAGAILDYIHSSFGNYNSKPVNKCYSIEQSPDLIHLLQQKKYKVIDTDFLSYAGGYSFDLIAMNPPFSNGDQHLLKAWDILDQGHIVCLLNRETIDNPYSRTRQLLCEIISKHGTTENLGPVFAEAERPTNCEIVMVRLKKENASDRFNFFTNVDRERPIEFTEETLNNQVARANIFEALVSAYDATKAAYIDLLKAQAKHRYYDSLIFGHAFDKNAPVLVEAKNGYKAMASIKDAFNDYLNDLKINAWNYVLNKTNIKDIITSDVRKDFENFAGTQGALDFTVKNINAFFDMLLFNRNTIMDKCVLSVFDHLCSFDAKNRVHLEGWKTNDAHKINTKVILPNFVEYDIKGSAKWNEKFRVNYHYKHGILHDIDKVLCYITGQKVEDISTIQDSLNLTFERIGGIRQGDSFDNISESEFFTMRFFKKGTLHLEFKDRFTWQEFNMRVAKNRNWLPTSK